MKRSIVFPALTLFAGLALAQDSRRGWRSVDEAEPAPAAAPDAPSAAAPANITIPAGTFIRVRVNEGLSTKINQPGDSFTVTLSEPIVAQGVVIARRGQTFGGHVAEVEKGGRIKGTSRMGLELTNMTLVDGQQIPIRSELIQFSGGTSKGRDAAAIVATSGVGAIAGGAAQGAAASGIGAAAGAAAATIGVLVTRGPAAEVYPEDTLTFRTLAAIPVSTESAPQAFQAVRQSDYEPQVRTRQPVRTARMAPPMPVWGGWGPGWGYPYYGFGPRVTVFGSFGRGGYGNFGRGGRRWR